MPGGLSCYTRASARPCAITGPPDHMEAHSGPWNAAVWMPENGRCHQTGACSVTSRSISTVLASRSQIPPDGLMDAFEFPGSLFTLGSRSRE